MIIEIRPIERKTWHGKKGVESFAQDIVVEALVNASTGEFETGLTEEERIRLEKATGYNLNPKISIDGKPHPFYGSKIGWLRLPNRTILLDTDINLDFIKYKLAKASPSVANSLKDLEDGLFPEATHVIFDEEMETQRKASKVQIKNTATKHSLSMSLDEKVSLIQILKNKSVKGRSQDFVDVYIDEIISENPKEFLEYAQMESTEMFTRALVLEALYKNILTKEGTSVYYMGNLLGNDYEEAVKFFLDPNNQKQKVLILEKLNK